MTRDDIIRMAREAGIANWSVSKREWYVKPDIEKAFLAGAAAEREACAKLCDAEQKKNEDHGAWLWEAKRCAAAIRARSTT